MNEIHLNSFLFLASFLIIYYKAGHEENMLTLGHSNPRYYWPEGKMRD